MLRDTSGEGRTAGSGDLNGDPDRVWDVKVYRQGEEGVNPQPARTRRTPSHSALGAGAARAAASAPRNDWNPEELRNLQTPAPEAARRGRRAWCAGSLRTLRPLAALGTQPGPASAVEGAGILLGTCSPPRAQRRELRQLVPPAELPFLPGGGWGGGGTHPLPRLA